MFLPKPPPQQLLEMHNSEGSVRKLPCLCLKQPNHIVYFRIWDWGFGLIPFGIM
jgi:hypothetical protein